MTTKKHSKRTRKAHDPEAEELGRKFRRLMNEKKPPLTDALVQKLNDMAPLDPTRRLALISLAWPFSETAKNCRADREFAVSLAGVADCLQSHVDGYRELSKILDLAQQRIIFAVCARKDSTAIFEEGKKSVVSYDSPEFGQPAAEGASHA